MHSAEEYCVPIWINSTHTNKLNIQLCNNDFKGTLKSTPLKWLPVLSNTVPPKIQREQALIREWIKTTNNTILPLHTDLRAKEGKLI